MSCTPSFIYAVVTRIRAISRCGHGVTAKFRRTQIVSPVAALSIAPMGVTTSCELSSFSDSSSAAGCSNSSCCSQESRPVSLLERLHAPTVSELSRKRKIHANPPPVGKKRSTQTVRKFDPQSVRPLQRVNELLVESSGKLFCRVCRENVAVKRSVVQNHIKFKKPRRAKKGLRKRSPGKGTLQKHSELMMLRHIERVRHCLKNTMSIELKL